MINYFQEAEKILSNRATLEQALKNLERRRDRIIQAGGPSGFPSLDLTQPYVSSSSANNALTECLKLVEVTREIATTKETIAEIDGILGQLEKTDEAILRAWYIEQKTKEHIAEKLKYSSPTTVYDLRNKAVSRFALLYFGAGALASI